MKLPTLLFVLLASTSTFAQKSATSMTWLAGTWKIHTGQGYIVEKWRIINDSTLAGRSMFVKAEGDSSLQETAELTLRKGQWTFATTVVNQNNGRAVHFNVVFSKGTEFISENPTHDFPQRIAYRRIKNSLFASIEGKKNGKFGKQNFDFVLD
jgi:hypothetical protein